MQMLKTPVLCLIGGMFVIYFSVVTYAIHRGRDVKASFSKFHSPLFPLKPRCRILNRRQARISGQQMIDINSQ